MHKTINELSKGFKQRVGLAHAMMDDPEILVLDEPTSGLDPNQIIEIRDIIKQIGKEKTVILSTHILSEAEATCDRIVIINKGKIVANDSTQTLKQSASGNNLINISLQNAGFESVKQQLTSISGISDIVQISDDNGILNLKLACMSSADIRGDIYRKVRQTDWILIEMHQETQTLENIFRELTREN
jgi:ABC-2 type transport system ATP-binding protein